MRDPARIPIILARLQRLWEANPDMRLGQLILADPLAHRDRADGSNDIVVWRLFNIEDDALLSGVEAQLERPPASGYAESSNGPWCPRCKCRYDEQGQCRCGKSGK